MGIPFLTSFCYTPYQFFIPDYTVDNQSIVKYQGKLLYIEEKNDCLEYMIIINTPLQAPFLPEQTFYTSSIELIEFQFLWIRIYIKNVGKDVIKVERNKIYIKSQNQNVSPVSIKKLIDLYTYDIKEKPIFWYTIPKKPLFYFIEGSTWFKNFFTRPHRIEERKIKIDYYKNYFESYNTINIKYNEEVLFYLPFPHLYEKEQIYTLDLNLNTCNVKFDFKYKNTLVKTLKDKAREQDFLYILKQLENQNITWKDQLNKELEMHRY